jgi:hypothetical protein
MKALEGSGWLTSRPGRFTPSPQKNTVPIEQEAGRASVSVGTYWKRRKSLAPTTIRTPDHPTRSLVIIPLHKPGTYIYIYIYIYCKTYVAAAYILV